MRISETHKNGAKIEVQGFGAERIVEAWRKHQDTILHDESIDERPKVVGTSAYFSGAIDRTYDSDNGPQTYSPVIKSQAGFTP